MLTLTPIVLPVALALAALLPPLASTVHAFSVTSPSPSLYWVAGESNVLNWRYDAGDADVFDVHLLNEDQKSLNGNFQVGNALKKQALTAQVSIIRIPPGEYKLLLTNTTKYEKDKAHVYYTSDVFEIKPHGTPLSSASADASAASSSKEQGGIESSPTSSSNSSASAEGSQVGEQSSSDGTSKTTSADETHSTAPAAAATYSGSSSNGGSVQNDTSSEDSSRNSAKGVEAASWMMHLAVALAAVTMGGMHRLAGVEYVY